MMTGISLALIAASRSRPLTPGMRMSVMIASGCVRASSSATPSAESKQRTAMPACSSAFSSTQRMERSSSMTHTVSGLAIGALERQVDGEDGLARAARALDQAAVAADDVLGDGQTEPRAFRPAGDHGVENVLPQVLEDLVEVDRLFLERLVRADDAIHQVAQPVGLVNDDAGILLEPLVGEL